MKLKQYLRLYDN